ncbi:MAG: SUMF1/EgtB/PvdO family nonheme iron enzyme [Planctomycetota bacterium]
MTKVSRTRRSTGFRNFAAIAATVLALPILGAYADPPAIEFALVPATDEQPTGPAHDFRISRFEIRNDQFVAFLNDALANLDNEKGRYLYFDLDTGNVHIGADLMGQAGVGGTGPLLFNAAINGRIVYLDGSYIVTDSVFAAHPVTGVTWYGALKFCNWLTLASGLDASELAYAEGPAADLNGWRPVTISSAAWAVRDLTAAERDALLLKLGYRLPMDGGADGPNAYDEWLKAAAARREPSGALVFDALYGFGRSDPPTPADANYSASGDPFEPGTTPVGFYNGVTLLTNGTPTRDTDNAYGLYDVSGNVWEWLQDQGPADPTKRRNRGGSWLSGPASLKLIPGSQRTASSAVSTTGFRIVQRVVDAMLVTPQGDVVAAGPWGGPYVPPLSDPIVYRLSNVVNQPIDFTIASDAAWVTVEPNGGAIPVGDSTEARVSIAPRCVDLLPPGDNVATLRIAFGPEPKTIERRVRLTLTEPLTVSPAENLDVRMTFGGEPTPLARVYTLASASDQPIEWSADWEDVSLPPSGMSWLTMNGGPSAEGQIPPHAATEIVVAIDPVTAAALPVGVHQGRVTFTDDCTGGEFVRQVTLRVTAPFNVTPAAESISTGVFGGPFQPPAHTFTLTNLTDAPLDWTAAICGDAQTCTAPPAPLWVILDHTTGTLPVGVGMDVAATLTAAVRTLTVGRHSLIVRFATTGGFTVDRMVTVDVTGLRLEPLDDGEFRGPLGGPFVPESLIYSLRNVGLEEMYWTASVVLDPLPIPLSGLQWLQVAPPKGTILDPDGDAEVTITPASDAATLPPGTYLATVTVNANGAVATRRITLIVGGEGFTVPTVPIPPEDVQPGGPNYFYRIGKYEVTNIEFARFLNNARRHKTDERGQYLYHDIDSGSVYINDVQSGAEGTDAPSAILVTSIYSASVGRITYDAGKAMYVVADGFDDHPVVGVSWYGAAKFCNWLTLLEGAPPEQRVYVEGTSAGDWHSVVFDPASPLENKTGFRLPMDAAATTAAAYNEWYKAASRKRSGGFSARYGFGRDSITDPDANFLHSGDTADDGTTPVGFFNGVNVLSDGETPTNGTDNGYGLFDLCGNVAEWVHDLDRTGPTSLAATRGGHFNHPISFTPLRTDAREVLPADAALAFVGFRVAQSLTPMPLTVTQDDDAVRADGPVGGPYSTNEFTLRLHNDASYTLDDLIVSIDAPWLEVAGLTPTQVPPGSTVDLPLRLTSGADALSPSPQPPGSLNLVPATDRQPGGPDYDYWISTTEVTNDQFLTFLNDSLANPTNGRGAFMYHDLDSGSVYLNADETGAAGTDAPSAVLTTLLYDASIGRIGFVNQRYVVGIGYGRHPVVGVTWYGAIKYCNWLTLFAGMPEGLRAYDEGPDPADWHPVTVKTDDWRQRGINATERGDLIVRTVGYRLPMDDERTTESPFNEWCKAAAARTAADGNPLFDALYGFGRDVLTSADANYFAGGDTQPDATTPSGFFDGVNKLLDATTLTVATANRYGLLDVCGNVAEWTQDFFSPGDASQRATRGGSWRDPIDAEALRTLARIALPPEAANDHTGFRVVRGTGHVATVTVRDNIARTTERRHIILDLHEPLTVTPPGGLAIAGIYCDDFRYRSIVYTITNESASPMPWSVSVDPPVDWLTLAGPVPGELAGTIDPAPDNAVEVSVSTNEAVNQLTSGEYFADAAFVDDRTGQRFTRPISLTIAQPIRVDADPANPPSDLSVFWEGPLDGLPVFRFALARADGADANCDLNYQVRAVEPWLTVTPTDALTGPLPVPPASLTFEVRVNETAEALPVSEYTGAVEFSYLDPHNPTPPPPIHETIKLTVNDPLVIEQPAEPWTLCCEVSLENPPTQTYALTNRHSTDAIPVVVGVDVDWIDLTPPSLVILPGGTAAVTATLNEHSLHSHGEYPATLGFEDVATGHIQTRSVRLRITENLSVTPLTDFEAAGPTQGPIAPAYTVYRLTNIAGQGTGDIQWHVSADQPWVTINGGLSAAGSLTDGSSINVVVAIDPAAAPQLPPGVSEQRFAAVISFNDQTNAETATRSVSLTLVAPKFTLDEALVPASARQPAGPDYPFQMGRFHVTNAQFVAFLNDALANGEHPRGQYLFFHTTTGDVYLNTVATGESGDDLGGRTARMFSPAAAARIRFLNGQYEIVPQTVDYSFHPVTGVSWYGAVKFCNWLTLDQGIRPRERCYGEGPDLVAWRPMTISASDWAARDLTDDERKALVADCRGYRLPMDDGYNNPTPTTDSADDYNEWYKAAAWNETLRQNTLFGFGRNALTGADANFRCSGDGFEDVVNCLSGGTTPVAYYDGSVKAGAFATGPNDNTFGLYDMTGNVHQWLQGRYAPPTTIDRRTLRGGSWNDPANAQSLRAASRTLFAAPSTTSNQIGFRVVRTPAPPAADFDADGDVDLLDFAPLTACPTGPGGSASSLCAGFDFDGDADVDLHDLGAFQDKFTGRK